MIADHPPGLSYSDVEMTAFGPPRPESARQWAAGAGPSPAGFFMNGINKKAEAMITPMKIHRSLYVITRASRSASRVAISVSAVCENS